MLNTTNFPQSRLKQILADIDKAWNEIDELYDDIGGDSEEDAVRQSMFDACEKLAHITRFIKQHITEE
jgi:hypothetical protein